MRTLLAEVARHAGEEIEVRGWVHRVRELGKISFLLLRDRSGMAQCVLEGKAEATPESVVIVRGKVAANDKAPGGYEVQVRELQVVARAEPDLPVPVNQDPEKLSLEAVLDHRMISLRNPKILSIFKVQASILEHFAAHLRGEGFTEIKTSKLIGTGTEGGTGLFSVDYFDTKVFLAQSPQFYKQAMVASGLERVFEIGCAYRAEKHETPRHLNEYVSLDVEMAWIDSEKDLMDLEVRILQSIFRGLERDCAAELALWKATVPTDAEVERIPRVSHDQAREMISSLGGHKVYDVNPEGERILCDWAAKEHGVDAIFVHGFPRKKRPFYTYPVDSRITMGFDCLFRGLEITTGSRRINEYKMLLDNVEMFGLKPEGLADYLSIFKYGCPPHGGFAIGLERLTQKVLGLANVKEACLFPGTAAACGRKALDQAMPGSGLQACAYPVGCRVCQRRRRTGMSGIENDEPFIRKVESLIRPAEVSDLIFFSSLKKFIPPSLFKRVLYNTSKRYPRIGFVIEPYCLFLFFRLRDVEKARRLLPERYELAKARVFDGDPPEFYFGMGIFNTRASTFWGSRLETYLIATDRVTGITSWIFADILSDTIIAHPKTGIADPNCARAMYTTNSRGEVYLDFQQTKRDRGLELRGNLTRGTRRPLEQDLWIMGNASIGHVKSFGSDGDEPFAVVFDPAEVASALDIPVDDLRILRHTILPDFAEPEIRKAVCFPFAQHYIADSPGRRTFVKDPGDMVVKYNEIVSMDRLQTFSAKSLKTLFLVGALATGVASVVLLAVLLLGR